MTTPDDNLTMSLATWNTIYRDYDEPFMATNEFDMVKVGPQNIKLNAPNPGDVFGTIYVPKLLIPARYRQVGTTYDVIVLPHHDG